MKGRILVVNTGSTSTKIGFYDAGVKLFEQNLTHSAEEVARYDSVMDQTGMRRDAIISFLEEKAVALETIDIAMARGGLITPIPVGQCHCLALEGQSEVRPERPASRIGSSYRQGHLRIAGHCQDT